jgi:hypothetical protein
VAEQADDLRQHVLARGQGTVEIDIAGPGGRGAIHGHGLGREADGTVGRYRQIADRLERDVAVRVDRQRDLGRAVIGERDAGGNGPIGAGNIPFLVEILPGQVFVIWILGETDIRSARVMPFTVAVLVGARINSGYVADNTAILVGKGELVDLWIKKSETDGGRALNEGKHGEDFAGAQRCRGRIGALPQFHRRQVHHTGMRRCEGTRHAHAGDAPPVGDEHAVHGVGFGMGGNDPSQFKHGPRIKSRRHERRIMLYILA